MYRRTCKIEMFQIKSVSNSYLFYNKPSLVPIILQFFKWGHYHIFSISYNTTSNDLWPSYVTFDLIKGCWIGRSDKVSLWYVALLINTRFRFFYFFLLSAFNITLTLKELGGKIHPPSTFFVMSLPVVIFSRWNFLTFFLQALRSI